MISPTASILIRSRIEDETLTECLRRRIEEMRQRLERLEVRAGQKKSLVLAGMEEAGIKKLVAADFTLPLRLGSQSWWWSTRRSYQKNFGVLSPKIWIGSGSSLPEEWLCRGEARSLSMTNIRTCCTNPTRSSSGSAAQPTLFVTTGAWRAAVSDRAALHLRLWRRLRRMDAGRRAEELSRIETWAGAPAPQRDGDRMVSVAELRLLAADGLFSIGAHSISHAPLPELPRAKKRRKYRAAVAGARRLSAWPVLTFAYPFGEMDAECRGEVRCARVHPRLLDRSGPNIAPARASRSPHRGGADMLAVLGSLTSRPGWRALGMPFGREGFFVEPDNC